MTYNMTQLAASETTFDLINYANDATGQILLALFVMSVFFIMLMVLKRWEFDSALLSSSFVAFMISIILVYAELLALVWALVFLIMAALTAFYMFVIKTG